MHPVSGTIICVQSSVPFVGLLKHFGLQLEV